MDDLADEAERLAAEAERLLRPRHRDHDDRHHITDPYADMPRWVLTMKRTRICPDTSSRSSRRSVG